LTDQHGQRVSLAAYRGRPVIVTFIDPFCRNLCPWRRTCLNEVDRELPRAKRVPIIAVSVDIYADTKADLHQDLGGGASCRSGSGVGAPPALARVWHDYAVGVQVATKRRAGIVEHIIAHEELRLRRRPARLSSGHSSSGPTPSPRSSTRSHRSQPCAGRALEHARPRCRASQRAAARSRAR